MEEIKRYMLIENNIVTAFYSTDVNENIPKQAIEITEELHDGLLKLGQAKLKKSKETDFTIEDFEENIIEPTETEIQARKVQEAKKYLQDTDYVVIKMSEYSATGQALDNDYAEVLAEREEARKLIRESEAKLDE